jgi:hypothetical protein
MVSYLNDTNSFELYNGSAWQSVPAGTATYATTAGTAVFATNAGTATTISGSIAKTQVTGTAVTTADTATVTNAMLAGSIENGKLVNSVITLNGTAVPLGGSATISGGTAGGFTNPMTNLGDLIVGGTAGVAERLGIGTAGQYLTTNGTTASWAAVSATDSTTPNLIINGAFDIWQRGTSVATGTTFTYSADRWQSYRASLVTGATVSRQAAQNSDLPDVRFAARVQRISGNTSTNIIAFQHNLETANSIPLAGKVISYSFYARSGANFSSSGNALTQQVFSGTGTDQNVGSAGFTGQESIGTGGTATLTTTWQRFTRTATVPANSTQLAMVFSYTPSGTAGANDWFEITGVQMEAGSVATPFKRNAPSIQGELAACQRYYFRQTSGAAGQHFANGNNQSTTVGSFLTIFPVFMRVAPTALEQTGTAGDYSIRHQATNTTCSAVPTHDSGSVWGASYAFTVASGLTAGNGSFARPVNSTAYLGWSAEL